VVVGGVLKLKEVVGALNELPGAGLLMLLFALLSGGKDALV